MHNSRNQWLVLDTLRLEANYILDLRGNEHFGSGRESLQFRKGSFSDIHHIRSFQLSWIYTKTFPSNDLDLHQNVSSNKLDLHQNVLQKFKGVDW